MTSKLLPKDKNDLVGICATLFLLLLVTLNDLNTLYNDFSTSLVSLNATLVKIGVGLYLLVNVLVNMYRAIMTDTTIHALNLPRILLAEWRYCSACELNAPPRSFHCFSCNRCVLKRNNHCMFLGKCAGHNNYRFYIMFIVYVWLGTVFSVYVNQSYYVDIIFNFEFKKFFIAFVPMFAIILRMISILDFFFVFANSICFILTFMLLVYMLVNLRLVLMGQTWHENAKGVRDYQLDSLSNLKEVLGRNLLSAIFNPFSSIDLPSDGTSFKKNAALIDANKYQHQNQQQQQQQYQQFVQYDNNNASNITHLSRRNENSIKNI